MGVVSKVNDVLCANISKIDDVVKANALYFDDNIFCTPTPTVTPSTTPPSTPGSSATATPTPTITPTRTPTYTPTATVTPTVTPTYTPTATPTFTPTSTVTPTVTQSPAAGTPTPTPTPTETQPCDPGCCYVELCFSPNDCTEACECNTTRPVYLSRPCKFDPCTLAAATGIFNDDTCSDPAPEGYWSDGTDCYSWFSGVLTYDTLCR